MRRNQNFEKMTYLPFRLFGIFADFFSPFLFLFFLSFCCSGWSSTGLVSSLNFCSEIFTEISNHFRACFKLNWPNHFDLGIDIWSGKDLFLLLNLAKVMPVLFKSDDFRSWKKANAGTSVSGVKAGHIYAIAFLSRVCHQEDRWTLREDREWFGGK